LLGFLDGLKDVMIIVAALATIAVLVLLAMLVLQVLSLVKQIKAETKPLIDETQRTMQTVRGTSSFIGSELVKPLITAVSVVSGVQRGVRVLADLRSWNVKTQRNRRLRQAARDAEGREVAGHEAERSA
jgi:uncharacterized membrane protein YjgN (DUF898 family)